MQLSLYDLSGCGRAGKNIAVMAHQVQRGQKGVNFINNSKATPIQIEYEVPNNLVIRNQELRSIPKLYIYLRPPGRVGEQRHIWMTTKLVACMCGTPDDQVDSLPEGEDIFGPIRAEARLKWQWTPTD
jgi:hypothetical protein